MDGVPTQRRNIFIDLAIIVMVVSAFYITRIADLSIRGEESRWASIAQEMLRNGDWIVPRQQGIPFASRPPMGSWLIALASMSRGASDLTAVRLPAVLAVLGMSMLIYGYGRSYLPSHAALFAAIAYATMPEILQMGRLAESDSVFAFFLGGAFLSWHWGWTRGRSHTGTWCISYGFLAMATLTKGPQAPVTFGLAVGTFLCATGQWRALLSRSHLIGLGVFAGLLAVWIIPFSAQTSLGLTWRTLAGESAGRFVGWRWLGFLEHFVRFPWEAIGCTAPWSFALVAWGSRRFRSAVATPGSHGKFLLLCIGAGFLPCWITPGGQTRYLMPLYPCVAVLIGMVAVSVTTAESIRWIRSTLRAMRWVTVSLMVGSTGAVAWMTWSPGGGDAEYWRQPTWLVLTGMVTTWCVAGLVIRFGILPAHPVQRLHPVALAIYIGVIYTGFTMNQLKARQTDAEVVWNEVSPTIQGRMVSVGWVHHKFLYLYNGSIPQLPDEHPELVAPGDFFCYTCWGETRRTFPFPCQEIAAVNMDRIKFPRPQTQVIIVRRTDGSPDGRLSVKR